MMLDWEAPVQCDTARHFDDLLQQATCELSGEVLEMHPLSFHVRLNANDMDEEPTFRDIQRSDDSEQRHWMDAIDAELQALYDKDCYALVDKEQAEGRQIVDSTWVFKRKRRPDGSLLKYKARLCIRGDQMYEGLNEGEGAREVRLLTSSRLGYPPNSFQPNPPVQPLHDPSRLQKCLCSSTPRPSYVHEPTTWSVRQEGF